MPCRPGATPVAMLVHTTGEITGSTGSSSAWTPLAARAARFGSSPAARRGAIAFQDPPSIPTRTTRRGGGAPRGGGRPGGRRRPRGGASPRSRGPAPRRARRWSPGAFVAGISASRAAQERLAHDGHVHVREVGERLLILQHAPQRRLEPPVLLVRAAVEPAGIGEVLERLEGLGDDAREG